MFRWDAIVAAIGVALAGHAFANDFVAVPPDDHGYGAAVIVPDGTVLFVGGGVTERGFHRYDPVTNRWSALPDTLNIHGNQELVLLRDGGLLLPDFGLGARYDEQTSTWTEYSFWTTTDFGVALDPGNGVPINVAGRTGVPMVELAPNGISWTAIGTLPIPVAYAAALVLPGGDLLVVGGQDGGSSTGPWVQRFTRQDGGYAPRSATWMSFERRLPNAVLLTDGRVLAASGTAAADAGELYDAAADQWVRTGPMVAPHDSSSATLLPNGKVYVAGDRGPGVIAELFDPATSLWLAAPSLKAAGRLMAAILPNGRVFLCCGLPGAPSAEVYDPSLPTLDAGLPLNIARSQAAAVTLAADGSALVIGGAGPSPLASTEIYASGTWSSGPAMRTARAHPVIVTLADGRILVTGGGTATELFDPQDRRFHPAAPLAVGRDRHALVRLADGRVLAFGGADGGQILASVELYDPGEDRWQPVADLPQPRADLTATLLPQGQVLIVGGSDPVAGASVDVWTLEPSTLSYTPQPSLLGGRRQHTATVMNNGQVLVAGGLSSTAARSDAELFSPSSPGWTPLPPMLGARADHSAVLLQNGKVWLAGGDSAGSTELYDLVTNTFRAGPPLPFALSQTAATLMPDHRVLLAGGTLFGAPSTAAVLFDEGRGALAAWTPQLGAVSAALPSGSALATGSGFTPTSTASSGAQQQISANVPVLTARLPGGADLRFRTYFWDDARAPFTVPAGTPIGPYALTVTTNGVPSSSQTLWVGAQLGQTCSVSGDCLSRSCDAGLCVSPPSIGPCVEPCDVACGCDSLGAGAAGAGALLALLVASMWRARRMSSSA